MIFRFLNKITLKSIKMLSKKLWLQKLCYVKPAKYVCNKWWQKFKSNYFFRNFKMRSKQRKHDSKMYAYIKAGREKLHLILMQPLIIQSTARRRVARTPSNLFSHSRQQRKRALTSHFNAGASVSEATSEFQHLRKKLASRTMTRILFTACAPKVQREKEGSGGGVRHVLSRGLLRRMYVWRTWAPGKHTYNHNPKIITSAWQTHAGVSAYTQQQQQQRRHPDES